MFVIFTFWAKIAFKAICKPAVAFLPFSFSPQSYYFFPIYANI